MSTTDWIILVLTLAAIILYGVYKSKSSHDLDGYFRGNREMPWYMVLISIVGTQASAVTFLSAPGQAYTDGMRFVQYYFGLPLAMVVLCITFVPMFRRLNLITAYEFLEKRFDVKTRTLTSLLFLISRGLSTGISVYAPSIILSSLLGWNIYWTNLFMGGLLIIYTVTGGAKAVAHTQKLQLAIIFTGLFAAAWLCVRMLPEGIGFYDALNIGGKLDKMNVITTGMTDKGFDWSDRFNLFSGVIGGFFLALSYFGTDQSQVGRFLTARSDRESRLGLLLNGLVKVPMQFLILLIGILVFAYYQFTPAPLLFNDAPLAKAMQTQYKDSILQIKSRHDSVALQKSTLAQQLSRNNPDHEGLIMQLDALNHQQESLRKEARALVLKATNDRETNDTNYIFLRFVVDHLPRGLVGLLIAVIFLAAWGSIAAALNALASASVVDFHKKFINRDMSPEQDYRVSRGYTLFWGLFCVVTAQFVTGMGSLIEAVNVLGSWFYGIILAIFLIAFYLRRIGGNATFWAALIGQAAVLLVYANTNIAWLWLNVIGVGVVVGVALLIQALSPRTS
jgi:solute:Na+ symporter, SSS family